jgi:ribosomal protein S18 acetylase RimI-like enzyme
MGTAEGYMDISRGIILKELRTEELLQIQPLWEELRAHHVSCSTHFREWYRNRSFGRRAEELRRKAERGAIRICTAVEEETGTIVGYCVSTITDGGKGEIDSVVVKEGYRGKGIGSGLVEDALRWFSSRDASPVIVLMAVGNDKACSFYERYGFFPRQVLLQRKEG